MKLQKALWVPAIAALGMASFDAAALGTTAGTQISNTATLTYESGSTAQPPVKSRPTTGDTPDTPTTFDVDLKIDFTVSRVATTTYKLSNSDGTDVVVSAYDIINDSNAPIAFLLSSIADATDGSTVAVDGANGTVEESPQQTVNPVTDTASLGSQTFSYTQELWTGATFPAAGGSALNSSSITGTAGITDAVPASTDTTESKVRIYVTVDEDSGFTATDEAIIALLNDVYAYTATVDSASVAVDTAATNDPTDGSQESSTNTLSDVDIVYADTDRDNKESVTDAIEISAPYLVLVKTAAITDDGITGNSVEMAIPGATITYSFAVQNLGSKAAANVMVADPVPANTTYASYDVTSVTTRDDGTDDSATTPAAPASVDDVTAVTLDAGDVAAGATTTVSFTVTID